MIDKNVVKQLVEEWLDGKDYFLTDLTVSPDDRIVVEIDHVEGVWIEDCVDLSRYIEERLNRDEEDYELEVGSAGIGQPFKVHRQYEIHVDSPVVVLTGEGKKLRGILKAVDADHFVLTLKDKVRPEGAKRPQWVDKDLTFRFEDVKYTKYDLDAK